MNNKLVKLKEELILLLISYDKKWEKAVFYIQFPPFTNKGFEMEYSIQNQGKEVEGYFKFDDKFRDIFFDFWYETKDQYNEIVFKTKKDDYENATIEARFNQEVEDNFQNNLPKSKRGKTIPWWKNEKYKREID